MKHCERDTSGKLSVRERHGSGIARYDLNVALAQAGDQGLRQVGIDFKSRDTLRGEAQKNCCKAGPRSEFEDIRSEIGVRKGPRYSLMNDLSPSRRAAQPVVQAVHLFPLYAELKMPQHSGCRGCALSIL